MRRDGVSPEGPAVFKPSQGDHRTVYLIPVGGTVLTARLPGFVADLPAKPVRESVHYMSQRPVTMGPLAPDPYKLDEMLADQAAERARRDAEKQVEQPA